MRGLTFLWLWALSRGHDKLKGTDEGPWDYLYRTNRWMFLLSGPQGPTYAAVKPLLGRAGLPVLETQIREVGGRQIKMVFGAEMLC